MATTNFTTTNDDNDPIRCSRWSAQSSDTSSRLPRGRHSHPSPKQPPHRHGPCCRPQPHHHHPYSYEHPFPRHPRPKRPSIRFCAVSARASGPATPSPQLSPTPTAQRSRASAYESASCAPRSLTRASAKRLVSSFPRALSSRPTYPARVIISNSTALCLCVVGEPRIVLV